MSFVFIVQILFFKLWVIAHGTHSIMCYCTFAPIVFVYLLKSFPFSEFNNFYEHFWPLYEWVIFELKEEMSAPFTGLADDENSSRKLSHLAQMIVYLSLQLIILKLNPSASLKILFT